MGRALEQLIVCIPNRVYAQASPISLRNAFKHLTHGILRIPDLLVGLVDLQVRPLPFLVPQRSPFSKPRYSSREIENEVQKKWSENLLASLQPTSTEHVYVAPNGAEIDFRLAVALHDDPTLRVVFLLFT